jgi:hypothetical protein
MTLPSNSSVHTLPIRRGENVVELVVGASKPSNYDLIEDMSTVVAIYKQILDLMSEGVANGTMSPVAIEAVFNRLAPVRDGLANVIDTMATSRIQSHE